MHACTSEVDTGKHTVLCCLLSGVETKARDALFRLFPAFICASSQLAACVKTIKDSLGSSSAGSQLAPHLDRLASLAQEQGKLMQSLLADRDLVLRKVAELKSVMGLQAQVAAAAQAQAAAAANSAAPSSVGAAPVPS